jgi:hypothetical protein
MNLAAYIEGLWRSAHNLPATLRDWAELDDELRGHYAEALIEQMAKQPMARQFATRSLDQTLLAAAWGEFVQVIVRHANDITALMALHPLELLAPHSVSASSRPGADAVADDESSFGVAA